MTQLANILYNFQILSEIMHYAGWSILIGIFIAATFVVLLLLLVRGFYPKSTFSTASVVSSVMLGFLLSIQFIPACASIALKSNLGNFETWLNENVIHPELYVVPEEISREESHEIVDEAVREYPMLGTLVGSGEFIGYNTDNIAHAITETLRDFLNWLIIKLLLVALVETMIFAFLIIRMQDKAAGRRVRQRALAREGISGGSRRRSRPVARMRRR